MRASSRPCCGRLCRSLLTAALATDSLSAIAAAAPAAAASAATASACGLASCMSTPRPSGWASRCIATSSPSRCRQTSRCWGRCVCWCWWQHLEESASCAAPLQQQGRHPELPCHKYPATLLSFVVGIRCLRRPRCDGWTPRWACCASCRRRRARCPSRPATRTSPTWPTLLLRTWRRCVLKEACVCVR